MTTTELVGWLATLVAISIGIPQIVRLARTRSTAGLSLLAWRALLAINIAWAAHGFLIDALNMIVTNLVSVFPTSAVLILTMRERGLRPVRVFLPSVLVALTMAGVDFAFGTAWFGVVAVVVAVAANAGQGIRLVRSPSIDGVAPGFLFVQFSNQVLWFAWAQLVQDQGTMITSSSTGVIALFNVVWWMLRRSGLPPRFTSPDPECLEEPGTAQVSCDA